MNLFSRVLFSVFLVHVFIGRPLFICCHLAARERKLIYPLGTSGLSTVLTGFWMMVSYFIQLVLSLLTFLQIFWAKRWVLVCVYEEAGFICVIKISKLLLGRLQNAELQDQLGD